MGTLFYYLIFSLLIASAMIENTISNKNKRFIIYSVWVILLILMAGLRGKNVSNDYDNYLSSFNIYVSISDYFSNPVDYGYSEPGIYLVIAFMHLFSITYVKFLFITFASIAILIKIKAVVNLSPWVGLSIVVLFSNYYLLHEMTQIRGAIAVALLLLAIPDIYNRRPKALLLKAGLGCIVHYSSILIIPLYFLHPKLFNRYINVAILIASIILGLLNITVFTLIDKFSVGVISLKLNQYYELLEAGVFTSINKFNVLILLRICIACFCIYYAHQLKEHSKYAYLILKLYILSICSFYLFSSVPAIAFRISEMLGISEIILLPMIVYVFKEKTIAVGFVIGFALLNLVINVQILKLVNPYF